MLYLLLAWDVQILLTSVLSLTRTKVTDSFNAITDFINNRLNKDFFLDLQKIIYLDIQYPSTSEQNCSASTAEEYLIKNSAAKIHALNS